MAVTWRNNGEKTDEGDYIVDVDPENGQPVQTFRAKTRKDVADQLAAAQFNASRTIHTLKSERTPDAPSGPRKIEPRPLSADERMRIAVELQDPSKADTAVKRLVESVVGPLDEIARRENERIEREEADRAVAETHKFVTENPDWYPTAKNKTAVFNYIENNNLAITAKNMGIAWDELKASGQADLKPAAGTEEGEEDDLQAQPVRERRRLASYATGVRESDISQPAPEPGRRKKYTWADLDKMGAAEYERRLKSEPGFMAAVDALGPRP